MMTIDFVKDALMKDGSEVHFVFNKKKSGIEPIVKNGVFAFDVWCGEKTKTYTSFNEVISDTFFDGKTFKDLINDGVEISFT